MSNQKSNTIPDSGNVEALALGRMRKAKPIAEKLGIHPKTIFRWADAHPDQIRRYKPTQRTVLFSEDDVAAFIQQAKAG